LKSVTGKNREKGKKINHGLRKNLLKRKELLRKEGSRSGPIAEFQWTQNQAMLSAKTNPERKREEEGIESRVPIGERRKKKRKQRRKKRRQERRTKKK